MSDLTTPPLTPDAFPSSFQTQQSKPPLSPDTNVLQTPKHSFLFAKPYLPTSPDTSAWPKFTRFESASEFDLKKRWSIASSEISSLRLSGESERDVEVLDEQQEDEQHEEEKREVKRLLTENELSYFLPARADGANDMYLHHHLTAPQQLMSPQRILHIFTLQLLRHPLLAARVSTSPTSYTDTHFVYNAPSSLSSALHLAQSHFSFEYAPNVGSAGGPDGDFSEKNEDNLPQMVNDYLNGPRTLSNERLGMLQVRANYLPTPPASPGLQNDFDSIETSPTALQGSYEIMLLATHFIGDGMALHTFMNEFYTLLGSPLHTIHHLSTLIQLELSNPPSLPSGLETRLPSLPQANSTFVKAVGKEEYNRSESKLIGGQSFPGSMQKGLERQTVVPTFAFSAGETKEILGRCKKNGVTVATAIFAACNLAWARRTGDLVDPCLIYSALNLRPNMLPLPSPSASTTLINPSYFHLAIGYFNIILPTLRPSTLTTSELFWYRSKMTKNQMSKAVKSDFVLSRSRESSKVRAGRAVKWAGLDDEDERRAKEKKAAESANPGLGLGMTLPDRNASISVKENGQFQVSSESSGNALPTPDNTPPMAPKPAASESKKEPPQVKKERQISQKALMGVSMLGNLDGMYKHAAFGDVKLRGLMTGSRQRKGGLLLFAYTFTGKLWVSLGYDVNGFETGSIQAFWAEVKAIIREVML